MAQRRPGDARRRAIELLGAGDWRRAHEIVQTQESTAAAWLHGIVQTLGGAAETDGSGRPRSVGSAR